MGDFHCTKVCNQLPPSSPYCWYRAARKSWASGTVWKVRVPPVNRSRTTSARSKHTHSCAPYPSSGATAAPRANANVGALVHPKSNGEVPHLRRWASRTAVAGSCKLCGVGGCRSVERNPAAERVWRADGANMTAGAQLQGAPDCSMMLSCSCCMTTGGKGACGATPSVTATTARTCRGMSSASRIPQETVERLPQSYCDDTPPPAVKTQCMMCAGHAC